MSSLEGRCVLVVEDEFYLAKDVHQTLKSAGARVLGPFPGRDEAVEAMELHRPDCAILDLNLGGGASFELADRLHAKRIPFLFFTGYDQEVIPPRFADVRRLEKPVDTTRLVSAAREVCEESGCGSA